jgi:hypothetical protein
MITLQGYAPLGIEWCSAQCSFSGVGRLNDPIAEGALPAVSADVWDWWKMWK